MTVFLLIPVVTIILGGGLALKFRPSAAAYSIILHFSAGVVFSVVAVEILPEVIRIHDKDKIIIGFASGIAAMLCLMFLSDKIEQQTGKRISTGIPLGLVVGVLVDIAIDGFLLGIGFAAGYSAGKLLAFALATENLTLSLATVTGLQKERIKGYKIFLIILLLATIFAGTSLLGTTLLAHLSDKYLELVLSFGLAALLFLVTEELLVKAHRQKDNIWLTAPFFIGFLLFLILGVMT